MSELITTRARANIRLHLLASVSALSLLTASASQANAEDADRPTVWIELGAQISHLDGSQQPLAPPFLTKQPRPDFEIVSPLVAQRLPRYSVHMDGKLSFEPEGTNWVFTAAIRYGRSNGNRHTHQQTPGIITKGGQFQGTIGGEHLIRIPARFDDAKAKHDESHAIIDFVVGKDVGLGMFERGGNSVVNAGLRIAQFSVRSQANFLSNPDLNITHHGTGQKYTVGDAHHSYAGSQQSDRSFRGVGPSISWDASTPFVGNTEAGEITLDWGVNVAVLFGRQTASVNHMVAGTHFYFDNAANANKAIAYTQSGAPARSRTVVVPNVGGFAGASYRFPNAKVSLDYRADFFFGAMDGGIDTRKSYDRAFFGPFASISIGLGG